MEGTSKYHIGSRTLSVVYQSLTTLDHDVLVSSDDNRLSMGGGVSRGLAQAGGKDVRDHAQKFVSSQVQTRPSAGDVIVTTAGALRAFYIFHAVTIDDKSGPDQRVIELATVRCMRLADALGMRSIAFPALGTGAGGFPFRPGADVMVRALARCLDADTTVQRVTLALFARGGVTDADLNTFYEHAVGLASLSSQSLRLGHRIDDLHGLVAPRQSGLSAPLRVIGDELRNAHTALATTPETIEAIDERGEESGVLELGERAVRLSVESAAEVDPENSSAFSAALRVELEAWAMKTNAQRLLMTKLQNERATYARGPVPADLDASIEKLRVKLQYSYTQIEAINRRIAAQ